MRINEISENISHTSKRLRDIEREKKVKPGTDEWFKLWFSLPYLKEAKENIYDILEPEDCGPFDGGCVLVAQALQKIHGGDIVVLINDRGNADHAAVKIGNTLLDFDGPLPVDKFVKRFEKNEHVKITGIRPMKDSDLPEATRNQTLLPKIVNLLSKGVTKAKENITNEDRHPNDRPYGPETKPTMPKGTVRVDVSDVYDWYKLGMHISDLEGLGKHDFGKGPPSTIFSFGSEEQEHKYIKDLEKTGLTTTDIDPKDPKQPKDMPRQKTDPTYNVENISDVKKSVNNSEQSYMLQLERDKRANMLVLHILNKQTGKRTEVRGKLGYETNGYDPEDKLHQLLDKIGKSASVSDLMNGDVVSINPRHPQGPAALKVAHDLTSESNVFTNARMNAIKAGKTEFTVNGKTYKVTGDTKDEKEAVANLAEETGKEMLKIFRGMHHDAGMNKDMDRFILSNDWELRDFTPDMFPSEEEFFDYDDPFDRIIDIDYSHRVNLSAPIIVGPQFSDGKYSVIDGNHRAAAAQRMGKTIKAYFPVEKTTEARTFAPQQTPMQDLVNSYLFFTSFGQMGTSDGAKSSESAEKIKEVIRELSQSHKNLQNLDKQTLEKNKNKILTHIHDMMNYAIAHFREHLKPERFDAKKKQINDILTKYNNLTSTNENVTGSKATYTKPQLDAEWEEAERYPEFVKIGKEAWIELASKGKAVTIKSAKGINNTDAADPDSFKSLDRDKQARALAQLKSGNVEMPIVAVYPDGWKELIGGNTRLTAMLAQDGRATVWVFRVPDEVAELAENFADGKNPGRKGLSKRMGVNTKASVSSLRKTAKNSSGEKQRMAHWLANMKAGREK